MSDPKSPENSSEPVNDWPSAFLAFCSLGLFVVSLCADCWALVSVGLDWFPFFECPIGLLNWLGAGLAHEGLFHKYVDGSGVHKALRWGKGLNLTLLLLNILFLISYTVYGDLASHLRAP